jgi:hypothetical protein
MVLGLFEDKNKQQAANEAEVVDESPENPYAKKPDHVRAALNSAAKGAAIGGAVGAFTPFGIGVVPGMAIGAVVMGGVGINEENNRVKYDEVTLQTDAKKEAETNNLNWLVGGTLGTALAISGAGLIAIPAAVAAGWAVDHFSREQIENDVQQKQSMLASDQASAAYQAGVMDASMQPNGFSRRRPSYNTVPLNSIETGSVTGIEPAFGGMQIGQGYQGTIQSQADQRQFAEATR